MSDGPHHPIAEALRTAREEAAVRNHNLPSGPSPFAGEGIGALSGWLFFFGMVGAVLGGVLGRGLSGAIVGALVFAGGLAVVGFVARRTSFIWNRGPAWLWGIGGFVLGAFVGVAMNSDAMGWGIALAMVCWAFRSVYKDS